MAETQSVKLTINGKEIVVAEAGRCLRCDLEESQE